MTIKVIVVYKAHVCPRRAPPLVSICNVTIIKTIWKVETGSGEVLMCAVVRDGRLVARLTGNERKEYAVAYPR